MNILAKIRERFGVFSQPQPLPQPVEQRSTGYFAAEYSRITSSLVGEARHINEIIRWQGYTLLARSRQLADNNPYASKFLQMVTNNVCGPAPFQLQGRISTKAGKADKLGNSLIETGWADWSRAKNCDRYGRLSLADIYRLVSRLIARDGEVLIRLHEGRKAGRYGLQLQVIDTDRLDFNHNEQLAGGNVIHAGVEIDPEGRTVAFHIRKQRPADWQFNNRYRAEYERVPAEQMIHAFIALSAEQVRGVPWIYASLMNLHQLGAFEEAAIIAARVGAAKMGFFEKDPDTVAEYEGKKDSTGAKQTDAEPGTFEELPAGLKLTTWDPAYPDAQVEPFMKSCLRGVAAGYGVSYHTLGNNLEAVNFSSARAGVLDERDYWMTIQSWFSEHICTELYERWLEMSAMTGALSLVGSLDKYRSVYFQPRRWSWVDPLKDVNASIEAIKWGLKSRTEVIAEQGKDIADTFDQLAAESALAAEKNVTIVEEKTGGQPNVQQNDQTGE